MHSITITSVTNEWCNYGRYFICIRKDKEHWSRHICKHDIPSTSRACVEALTPPFLVLEDATLSKSSSSENHFRWSFTYYPRSGMMAVPGDSPRTCRSRTIDHRLWFTAKHHIGKIPTIRGIIHTRGRSCHIKKARSRWCVCQYLGKMVIAFPTNLLRHTPVTPASNNGNNHFRY